MLTGNVEEKVREFVNA